MGLARGQLTICVAPDVIAASAKSFDTFQAPAFTTPGVDESDYDYWNINRITNGLSDCSGCSLVVGTQETMKTSAR